MPASGALVVPAHSAGEQIDRLVDDRYRLLEVLGTGGAAVVRRALDERLGRVVALKLFHPGVTEPERQTGEIRIMAGLAHPALVRLYDGGTCADANGAQFTYLALEFVDGPTLRTALVRGPLAAADVAGIGADLARALDHLHGRGIVHRDVKPANVLLPSGGDVRAKLGDFGVARLLDGTRVTATGATVGTANYLSPEQVRGEQVGPASDVWSLGLVLLESLTGTMEYPGSGVAAATARLARQPEIPSRLGAPWTELLARMLAADPVTRPSAREVTATLVGLDTGSQVTAVVGPVVEPGAGAVESPTANTAWLGHEGLLAGPGTEVLVEPRHRGRRAAWWCLAAACALAMLAVLVVSVAGAHNAPAAPAPSTGTSDTTPSQAPAAPASVPAGSVVARHRSPAATPATSAATPPAQPVQGKGAKAEGHGKGHGRGKGQGDDGGDGG